MLPMQNIFNAFFFTHSIDIAEAECCRHDFGGYYQLFFIHSFPLIAEDSLWLMLGEKKEVN